MTTANRKRNKAVTIRLTEAEYDDLQARVRKTGISQQAYIISAIQGAVITSIDELLILKEAGKTFADLVRLLRGLSTNINQIARIANSWGLLPAEKELHGISDQINDYRIYKRRS